MLRQILTGLLSLLVSAGPALAQEVGSLNNPARPRWYAMALAMVIIGAVLIPSFMSSRRTHQD
jgi:hypothetical protein